MDTTMINEHYVTFKDPNLGIEMENIYLLLELGGSLH